MSVNVSKLTVEELLQIKERLKELNVLVIKTPANQIRVKEYSSWDWTKSNQSLAAEHHCSMLTVAKWRAILKKPKVKQTKHYPACLEWDWTKSDTSLSVELGISLTTIRNYRAVLGKPRAHQPTLIPVKPARIGRPDFGAVDWNQPDIAISKQVGCTREYVRQKRAQLGISKCLFADHKYSAFLSAVNGAKELSYKRGRELTGISHRTLAKYCAKAGITLVKDPIIKKHPWHLMNWKIPNQILAQIWRVNAFNTVAARRNNHHLGPALFHTVRHSVPDQFKELVESEKAKAEQYFSTQLQQSPQGYP